MGICRAAEGESPELVTGSQPPTVVVTGQRAALEDSGVVLHLETDPLAASDVTELLSSLPGVQVRASGGLGSYSEASLRGSSGRQVRVLLDGLPLDMGGGEATSLSLISPLMLEGVDIYKGRVPLELGSGLAGSIDLRTRRELGAPVVGSAAIGSYGQRQFALAAQPMETMLIAAGTESADNDFKYRNEYRAFDPSDPDRRRRERRNNAGTGQDYLWYRYEGAARVSAHWLDQRQELPTRANLASAEAALDTRSLALSVATPERSTWQARLAHRYSREHFRDPASQIGLGAQDTRSRTHASQLQVSRPLPAQLSNGLALIDAEHTDYRAEDRMDGVPTAEAERLVLAPGLQWHSRPRGGDRGVVFNASLMGRWSQEETDRQDDRDEWQVEPAIGVSGRWSPVCVLSANLGRRERLPTFFERYGDRGLFRGNPGLEPESALYADAGLRCAPAPGERLGSFQLTAFGQELRDVISPTYNAQGVGRSVNTERAEIYGLELDGTGTWAGIEWRVGGTWQHTEDRSEVRATRGKQLPGRFERQLYAQLARSWSGLQLSYQFRYESGQYYDSANLLEAPSVLRHDAGVRGAWRQLGWSLQVLNLRDDNFEQFNGFPTPGRRVVLALTYPSP